MKIFGSLKFSCAAESAIFLTHYAQRREINIQRSEIFKLTQELIDFNNLQKVNNRKLFKLCFWYTCE